MAIRGIVVLFALLVLGCDEAARRAASVVEPHPVTADSVHENSDEDSLVEAKLPERSDSAPAKVRSHQPIEEEGCAEHIEAEAAEVRVTRYIKRGALEANRHAITQELPACWTMAEQAAPVSIADDFEHGISTEQRVMPDTIDVEVRCYERCSARAPHTVLHYRLWRAADGSVRWRER